MSDIKRCDRCGKIANARDCYKATFQLVDSDGGIYDQDESDACDDCKDEVNAEVTTAMKK